MRHQKSAFYLNMDYKELDVNKLIDLWEVTWILRRLIILLIGSYLFLYAEWRGLGFSICVIISGDAILSGRRRR